MNDLFQGYQIKNKLPVLHALVIWLLIQQLEYAGAPLETWCLMITMTTVSADNFLILANFL